MKTLRNILLIIILAAMAVAAHAATVTWYWDPPTTGSPVAHYVVEQRVDGGPWAQFLIPVDVPRIILAQPANTPFELRVAGVDSLGRQGPWATSAVDVYATPGLCGTPKSGG